ncbi:MAG TPA: DUF6188 family protein [Streptosporangiaceae bacterium]
MSAQQDGGLAELPDRWVLGYRGLKISQIRVDYRLTFTLEGQATIVIENDATLAGRPGRAPGARTVELHPERQDVGSALALFGATVNSGVAFKTGTLRLVLDHFQLTVRADPDYEAWSVVGPGDTRLVCMPGGQLTVWT